MSAASPREFPAPEPKPAASKFRLQKVLLVVIPVAILVAAIVAVAGFVDVEALFAGLNRPAIAPVQGRVLFNGKPLPGAQIMTKASKRGMPAIGWTDDEGTFTLKTDIGGKHVDGATVGEHRVSVAAFEPVTGPSPPALLTPEAYSSTSSTPLSITVSSSPDANKFELNVEGEPPQRAAPPAGGGGGGRAGGGGGGGGGRAGGGGGRGGRGGRAGPGGATGGAGEAATPQPSGTTPPEGATAPPDSPPSATPPNSATDEAEKKPTDNPAGNTENK